MSTRRIASVLAAAAATAAVFWVYGHRLMGGRPAPAPVAIQDGRTINFSSGSPVVANSAADKAALDAGVKAIDEATRNITFPAQPTPAK